MPYKNRRKKQDVQREWVRRKQKKARDAGTCSYCYGQPRHRELTTCLECTFKRFARKHLGASHRWTELRDLLYKQKHRCAYTGLPIDIGAQASIEHVEPVARTPRRRTDITNFKWVHREVNSMKKDMPLHEFVAMCKKICEQFHYEVKRDDSR